MLCLLQASSLPVLSSRSCLILAKLPSAWLVSSATSERSKTTLTVKNKTFKSIWKESPFTYSTSFASRSVPVQENFVPTPVQDLSGRDALYGAEPLFPYNTADTKPGADADR